MRRKVSSPYHRGKSGKHESVKNAHQPKQTQGKEVAIQAKEMGENEVEMRIRVSVPVAGEQSLYEEVKKGLLLALSDQKWYQQSQNQKMNILLQVPVIIKAFIHPLE